MKKICIKLFILIYAFSGVSALYSSPDLFELVRRGDLEGFNRIRTRISDYNSIDSNGDTPAIVAVKGYIQYKRSLSGTTPLHLAVSNNDTDSVKRLLARGASVDVWDEKGRTPYRRALVSKSFESAQLLLPALNSAPADPTEEKFSKLLDELLKEGVSPNSTDRTGKSLLVYAIQSDSSLLVRSVLKHHPDIKYRQTPYGPTALHYAVIRANPVLTDIVSAVTDSVSVVTREAEYRPASFITASSADSRYKSPTSYNLKIEVYSDKVKSSEDRRCYYKVFINKVEVGRTVTGLESQKKSYNAQVEINRHHIQVEKYVLDERQGKYVKLNNIHQPRPSAFYTDTVEGRIRVITVVHNESEATNYYQDFEKE
ncbi:MAG: ankyrin repeat domain-containing protein [Spirochaetes bacterium]|jgi:hypothetical protein|nr:ankyrin repeat domain-containing protein [Spirochaetota bacterium]